MGSIIPNTAVNSISRGARMRLQLGRISKILLVSVALVLVVVLYGLNLRAFRTHHTTQTTNPATNQANPAPSDVIMTENASTGTTDWQIPSGNGATTEIQAYASATSVSPGQTLTFFVSTQQAGTPYTISIYRLGWYGGLGGRLMATETKQVGVAQGYFDASSKQLVGCQSCHVDTQTGLVEANWQPSYRLTVPSDWMTGVYLAKFTDANNMQTYVPFDVRGNLHSRYIAVTADTTDAAYNYWGGNSLYTSNGALDEAAGKAVKVSFDRPYVQGFGSSFVLAFEADAIRWLERQGYDLSYISSVDLHEDPGQLLQHRAYISLGHDEYWTKAMRDGVEHARNMGVGLAFLEADAAYWQMRFEPDGAGTPDRNIVCYKVHTVDRDLARDPLYGKDNSRVTALWRDPVLNRPENALIGIMFSGLTRQAGYPWQVSSQATSLLLDGTSLQAGQTYGCGLVGYEWDRIFANGASPPGLQVLATSSTIDDSNKADVSNTTYYIAPSGAMVFATGSIYWAAALDSYRFDRSASCGQHVVVPGIQKLMANVMDALAVSHPSGQLALTSATPRLTSLEIDVRPDY